MNNLAAIDEYSERYEYIEPHPIRSQFQRDRDRILYSRAFRRLDGKTQVFLSVKDDHVRNRLTHTLEVNQIAQTVSKALGLNMELTEAIALGHDLGHTPFGHVGERTLNHIMNGCYKIADFNSNIDKSNKGFKHNLQGVRVAKDLESSNLNLTKQVLWGILKHSKLEYGECQKDGNVLCDLKHNNPTGVDSCNNLPQYKYSLDFYKKYISDLDSKKYWTIEGLVVSMADEIAQRHHDIEDAIEFNILSIENLVKELDTRFSNVFRLEDKELIDKLKNMHNEKDRAVGLFSKLIVDFLTTNLIQNTEIQLKNFIEENEIKDQKDFNNRKCDLYEEDTVENLVCFSKDVQEIDKSLQKFLYSRILNSFEAQRMDGLGQYVIRKLFEAYTYNPQQLPDKTIKRLYENLCYEIKQNQNNNSEIKKLLEYNKFKTNIKDIGKIRIIISKLHYKVYKEDKTSSNMYNDILLRTICDYISGMTDKYALEEHKKLYNC